MKSLKNHREQMKRIKLQAQCLISIAESDPKLERYAAKLMTEMAADLMLSKNLGEFNK